MFINKAWARVGDANTINVPTNSTYHQGAGVFCGNLLGLRGRRYLQRRPSGPRLPHLAPRRGRLSRPRQAAMSSPAGATTSTSRCAAKRSPPPQASCALTASLSTAT
jgi:hypothetical protein